MVRTIQVRLHASQEVLLHLNDAPALLLLRKHKQDNAIRIIRHDDEVPTTHGDDPRHYDCNHNDLTGHLIAYQLYCELYVRVNVDDHITCADLRFDRDLA